MADRCSQASLEDANTIVSDLAYWVASCDTNAALRMTEGFGAALSCSAAMRAKGSEPPAIALALAETADKLKRMKDAQHAGWLLLSLKVELSHLAVTGASGGMAQGASELSDELEQIASELMRRGTAALAMPR